MARKTGRKIVIIAGPNGAGKTTFAREFLPFENIYRKLVDVWVLYDNAGEKPLLLDEGEMT